MVSPIQYLHFRSLCHRSIEISTVQKSKQCLLQQCFNVCNIPVNMAIEIRLKIDPRGLQQKWFSGDFRQLLELRLLRTHIGGCFQSVRFRSSCLQNIRKVSKKTNVAESFWNEAAQNSKNSYFPKRALRVSFPFGLSVSFILQGY